MSNNPQFKRTDKAIMMALVSLLNKKPFEKITVQDILDETPVTRATFYAHYRDKYDIAEKMMAHFISTRSEVRKKLSTPNSPSLEIINKTFGVNHEFTKALLKIHTEKVDFRKAVGSELEREYLEGSNSPTREIEARIYAQAYVELYITILNNDTFTPSPEYTYSTFIPVALKMLNLNNDREAAEFLSSRVAKKLAGKI